MEESKFKKEDNKITKTTTIIEEFDGKEIDKMIERQRIKIAHYQEEIEMETLKLNDLLKIKKNV